MITTRFAPSPTGRLHVGNIRTALHNWMLAKKSGGRFLLRIDDTDAERSKEEYVTAIREDLAWLGIEPDGEERQSLRLDLYEKAFETLKTAGRVYPAYETAQELELKRKVLLGRGLPPIYDRGALKLSDAEREAKEAAGVHPHWRFKLDHDEPIAWEDGVRGSQKFDPATLSDPVIRRADGSWLHASASRRRSCLEHGGADPDVHGTGQRAAQICARSIIGWLRRQALQAARIAWLRCFP